MIIFNKHVYSNLNLKMSDVEEGYLVLQFKGNFAKKEDSFVVVDLLGFATI